MADDLNVTINDLFLYVPNLIPSVETQVMFNEAAQKNNFKISYNEKFTKRRVISDMITQFDIGSSQNVQSPKYLRVLTKHVLELTLLTKKIILL